MAEYTITFDTGTPIWNLYKRLGASDAELDQGYPVTDYSAKKRRVVGKGDKKIQREEVLAYAANSATHQEALKETMGYEIPWPLNDPKIKKLVNDTISAFDGILGRAGYKKGTDRYCELLGVSLFAFATASKRKGFSPIVFPKNVMDELTASRLKPVIDHIVAGGGLGLIDIKNDCSIESNAEEALKNDCGACTELSKILYTLFDQAGLNSRFIYVLPKPGLLGDFSQKSSSLHISVGLKLGNKTRLFDPTLYLSDARSFYARHAQLWFEKTNREFLSVHYVNLGSSYEERGDPDLAVRFYQAAIEIDPLSPEAHNNLAAAYVKLNKMSEAVREFRTSLKYNPINHITRKNLGSTYVKIEKLDLAAAEFTKAIRLDPQDADAHLALANIYYMAGKVRLSISEYKKAAELDPASFEAQFNLGVILNNIKRYDSAIPYLKTAIKIDPDHAGSHYILGTVYTQLANNLKQSGKSAEALKLYNVALGELELAHKLGEKDAKDYSNRLQIMIKPLD